ncbi:hypothetical protein RvY_04570 [Ramazzottius varieornatus]|uniref:Uncharacterized protein n=1 Tax=Ramazzottius varieornatus TaxID=947166 RepID=A0A1D1US28_RAMVA|nr:hypothetical protein RvY_04570 [Ramazzottius varieornatus]
MAAVDRNDRNGYDKADKPRKRRFEEVDSSATSKPPRTSEAAPSSPAMVAPKAETPQQETFQQMMRKIEERKKQMNISTPTDPLLAKKAELQAKINGMLAGLSGKVITPGPVLTPGVSRPTPLILDAEGRTIDLKTGKAVTLERIAPTLKANVRDKRKDDVKVEAEKVREEPVKNENVPDFFDPRVENKGPMRARRTFNFHKPGEFIKVAAMNRSAMQLARLQAEISDQAKKTGIVSAAALARIAPKKYEADAIPEVEWWDGPLAQNPEMLDPATDPNFEERIKSQINSLIEHPVQLAAPIDKDKTVALPMMLTTKERKKLRRQGRREKLKEEQEKQRLGLVAAPAPKVKMANLMRVLGSEAVQDPTKVEATVRAQIAKRRKVHETTNAQRKLSTAEKRQKKIRKIKEDTNEEVHVAIYRVKDLSHPAKKYKVETNANQLFMTGIIVLNKDVNLVVVEGGPKQQKSFKGLMLRRIKWADGKQSIESENPSASSGPKHCELLWEGTTKKRHFGQIKFKACPTDVAARDLLRKHGVEEYWDMAYGAAILESTDT